MDELANQVQLYQKLNSWMEDNGILKDLEKNLTYFHQTLKEKNLLGINCSEIFCLNLHLRFVDLEDSDLLYLLTKETLLFENLFINLVQIKANEFLKKFEVSLKREQIYCSFKLKDLPLIPTYKFSIKAVHLNLGLTTFCCVVCSKQPVEKYIRQSVWKCERCLGRPYKINRSRYAKSLVRCDNCLGPCVEIIDLRVTSSVCSARVFESDSFKKAGKTASLASSLELKLYDDVCQDLKLGHEYTVVGIFEFQYNFFNVWDISPVTSA